MLEFKESIEKFTSELIHVTESDWDKLKLKLGPTVIITVSSLKQATIDRFVDNLYVEETAGDTIGLAQLLQEKLLPTLIGSPFIIDQLKTDPPDPPIRTSHLNKFQHLDSSKCY